MGDRGPALEVAGDKPPIILLVNAGDVKRALRDRAGLSRNYVPNLNPNLGLLTLGTALRNRLRESHLRANVLYYDGTLFGDEFLFRYIEKHSTRIFLIGFSTYTCNYGTVIRLAEHAKKCRHGITIVLGNDHFSALHEPIMHKRMSIVDYGFRGNDVVEGFCAFTRDLLRQGRVVDLSRYPGLVYRDLQDPCVIHVNPEDPSEYHRLPLVDYSLMDSLLLHSHRYHELQRKIYPHIRKGNHKMSLVDLARGCLKFAGKRSASDIPLNACDFCAIVPGTKAILAPTAERAWEILRNAFEQGYDYLFVTADEFPATFWPLIKSMVRNKPAWYEALDVRERPRLSGYARADAFRENCQERIDVLMNDLLFEQFFVGIEAFTEVSLRAFNKGLISSLREVQKMVRYNLIACEEIARRGGQLEAGIVLTHLGITPELLETNFKMLQFVLERYRPIFAEIEFDLLDPLPGSHSFEYLRVPGLARQKAENLGLNVNDALLETMNEKYGASDLINHGELIEDFVEACCPDITMDLALSYLKKTERLLDRYDIACEQTPLQ